MPPDAETLTGARRRAGRAPILEGINALRADWGPVLAGSVLPFVLVFYLALEGGGYDAVVRSEIGIAVWWIVLLGALVGVLPLARVTPAAWAGLGLLTAFAIWTALGISWSESSERSVAELARVASYLGVLALAISAQGRHGLRRAVYSIGAALAVIGALALLSRLHPSWFPVSETAVAFESARARLNYPVNYWNGLAALMAIGVPLLLAVAVEARRVAVQALATAVIPVMALAAFYTLSRGGAGEMALVVIGFVALYPRRLAALPALLLAGGGSTLLILAATQRNALENGLSNAVALDQGNEMLAMTIVVCAGVALLRAAAGLASRHGLGPRPQLDRRRTAGGFACAFAVGVVAFLALGGPGEVSDRWEEFKRPVGLENQSAERFQSASGNGRYQYWEAAVAAGTSEPLIGIGPGTWEYFWAEEGSIPGFIRDAHSLYLETLAELGIVGLILVSGFIFGVIGLGAWRTFSASPARRPWFAAATTACIAFAAAAAVDWAWELSVIPIAFMLLAAGILAFRGDEGRQAPQSSLASRIILAGIALAALAAIAIPLAGTKTVRESQADVRSSRLGPALDSARDAGQIQPWAATPSLQQALVLELQGDLNGAAGAARAATNDEPTNWRTWLVLSRLEAYRGKPAAALTAYRQARSLNPRSALFAR